MPSSASLDFHGMVGRSAAMQALFRRVERVAPIDVPVLILGESGTGKELVARAIQRLSRRRDRPFETVNCGALPHELLLSELFGHERGAFTGAVAQKDGLVVLADGGTLFLDEVADLSAEAQVTLLRFLQEGEVRPVGAGRTRRVDVRVIAATHRDLEAAVDAGAFREDLYYRIRRVVVEVPALRDRREDIPFLIEHFRGRANQRYGLAVAGWTPQARSLLVHHTWRGNVRELEAVVEQAMILQDRGVIGPDALEFRDARLPARVPSGRANDADLRRRLTWSEREALRMVEQRQEVRRQELMARCQVSRDRARRELTHLVDLGWLERVGRGRAVRYVPAARG